MLSERENYIRNATFNYPEWIPTQIYISDATWDYLRYDLEDVIIRHPILFPNFEKGFRNYDNYDFGPAYTKGQPFTDAWGCIWETSINGLEGVVINQPLDDWDDLDGYMFPDANMQADRYLRDWDDEQRKMRSLQKAGKPAIAYTPHGFLFLRLEYLRGFENLMIDIAVKEPKLGDLIKKITQHNKVIVDHYLNMGIDVMYFAEDLGTQASTVISPTDLKNLIFPEYKALMKPCKDKGVLVAMHSDGRIIDIIDDLINLGIDIINPQDLCNGIENLAKHVKGKACIQLDIDRQKVIPFGTQKEIHELIEEEVKTLGDIKGGLEFVVGIYPPTSPENINALFTALEKYRRFWWK
ncbi:MAG: uroporphyrinogen decarboxylase family protein [Eubacteriales bacterium]|nr:uroporphyrinogen decarboxylase family protein [Eubacteriales bacterium]